MIKSLYLWRETGDMEHAHDLSSSGHHVLVLYKELRLQAGSQLLWKWYPKFHLFDHMISPKYLCTRGCHADSWNYRDESEIGAAVDLASALHVNNIHLSLLDRHNL